MAGTWTDLTVAARFALRTLGRRLRGEVEAAPDLDAFRVGFEGALGEVGEAHVASCRWIDLPATEPPWRDTGVDVGAERGRDVTLFSFGRVYASKALDIWVQPKNQIWTRVGEKGNAGSSSRATQTFGPGGLGEDERAAGRLFLGNYFPNDWKTRDGGERLQDDAVFQTVSGATRIAIVEWASSARAGLAALVSAGDPEGLASGELARLDRADAPPEGWHYLWHIGEGAVFEDVGERTIDCRVEGDVAILQTPVDVPFAEGCSLEWEWQIDALPGVFREDSLPSHDYLSVAVEFDHGWDITYYWSRELAPETGFVCPLPNWQHREYHVVVRQGEEGLGQRHRECRDLSVDHRVHLDAHAPTPTRIVGVWLIANSIFARRSGAGRFANIVLRSGDREIRVL
ncbi:MAG: DUF3047 domain-containing protein [Myxococcota bacterium]